jgi:hypothetical protein
MNLCLKNILKIPVGNWNGSRTPLSEKDLSGVGEVRDSLTTTTAHGIQSDSVRNTVGR